MTRSIRTKLTSSLLTLCVAGAALLVARPALALQPLSTFVDGAVQSHPETLEATAAVEQRKAEEAIATSRLLPSFNATASYTNNQYEQAVQFAATSGPQYIIRNNQFDAALVLSVPIVNVAAWDQRGTSKAMSRLASAQSEATRIDLEKRVVQAYYQLLASAAVHRAAETSLHLSEENATVVNDRRANGAATNLDVSRAKADVSRARQDVAAATLGETMAARNLFSLSDVEPTGIESFPDDDLHPEAPLSDWQRAAQSTPLLDAARAAREVADKQSSSARSVWYPTLTGIAQERFTNATALVGHSSYYSLQLSLGWHFDGATLHQSKAAKAQANAAEAREMLSEKQIDDAIYQTWQQVRLGIEKAQAARDQAAAAAEAVDLSSDQYQEGMATQLDVLAARQAAFAADVGRIQADADLAYARAVLRVICDLPLDAPHP